MNERFCPVCGVGFQPRKNGKPRIYCSSKCRQEGWRSQHSGVTDIKCDQCGKMIHRAPSSINRAAKHHFCSTACKGNWMSKNLRGANHPRYLGPQGQGLLTIIYKRLLADPRWKAWREEVFKRASGTCERCSQPAEDSHHKKHAVEILSALLDEMLDPNNGEALCASCHTEHHRSH